MSVQLGTKLIWISEFVLNCSLRGRFQ